ncbi:MAG TPA: diguanylate cyclase, partial [Methylobacterium sp.]
MIRNDANHSIHEELARLRPMADASVGGIVVLSDDRTILEANLGLGALLGRSARDLIGRPLSELFAGEAPALPPAMTSIEVMLGGPHGPIPAALHVRSLDVLGHPHTLLAFEDLRARRAAEERIGRTARYDSLTGLRNRVGLDQAMAAEQTRAERYGADFAVLCLDLDGFKAINDVHGHPAGDE